MTLDVDAARAAIERDVAEPLGIDVVEAAWGIERIVNANMANATRRVLARSRRRPPRPRRSSPTAATAPVHAWAIAAELGIDRILVPKAAPAFSALGVLVADYVVDLVRAYVVAAVAGRPRPRCATLMHEVLDEAAQGARADRARRGRRSTSRCSRRCATRARTST